MILAKRSIDALLMLMRITNVLNKQERSTKKYSITTMHMFFCFFFNLNVKVDDEDDDEVDLHERRVFVHGYIIIIMETS